MKNIRKWILYIVLTTAMVLFFLYTLFPSAALKDYVSTYLLKTYPDYQFQLGRLSPVLPLGLGCESAAISHKGKMWGEVQGIKITPDYLTLLSEPRTINFRGVAYNGSIHGNVIFMREESGFMADVFINLTGLRVDAMTHLHEGIGRKLTGVLTGDVSVTHQKGPSREIKGVLTLDNLSFELSNPIINVNEISLNDVQVEFAVNNKVFKLIRLEAKGGQVEGGLAGTVAIREPFAKSRINLRGSFQPQQILLASFQNMMTANLFSQTKTGGKGIPIRIYGTIENPKYSFK